MIKASLKKTSTNTIEVFIDSIGTVIDRGTISLNLYTSKKDSTETIEAEYSKDVFHYVFDVSDEFPYNIGEYNFILKITDGEVVEESRVLKLFGGAHFYTRGQIKKIQNDFLVAAKNLNGSLVYMLKKLPGKYKCDLCWDEDMQSSSNSNCSACGGTGFLQYYSKPYKTYAGPIHYSNEKSRTEDAGKVIENPDVLVSAIAGFTLTEDDMIFYTKTADWYRVKARTVSELNSIPVLQTFVASVMPSGSPEVITAEKILKEEI